MLISILIVPVMVTVALASKKYTILIIIFAHVQDFFFLDMQGASTGISQWLAMSFYFLCFVAFLLASWLISLKRN